jgi:histidinol phosphatase-like enzyme (inositol monophosphatase family)
MTAAINPERFIPFIGRLAEASAEVILPHYARPDLAVELKSDQTPVTAADRGAEERMRELIMKEFPEHGILGEEYGGYQTDAEFLWVLDPIDGTKTFTAGCPLFGTLIGLLHCGVPIAGAINQPVLRQLCVGTSARTTINGTPVRMRDTEALSQATLLYSDLLAVGRYRDGEAFKKLYSQVRLLRTWGDCYGYLLLAGGFADIMLDPIMQPWDLLPLIPVIQGAGGVMTTWSGEDPVKGGSCIAAGKSLHAEVLRILNE